MVQPIIKAVSAGLPAVFDYLNCRILPSNHISKTLQYDIKDECLERSKANGEKGYGITEVDDLNYPDQTQKHMFIQPKFNSDKSAKNKT